jgi:hypothetical protein
MTPGLYLKLMLTAMAGVTVLFAAIEYLIGPENRGQLSRRLRESDRHHWWRYWSDLAATQFDTVFGKRMISQRRLGRACAVSLICFGAGVGALFALSPSGIHWPLYTVPSLMVLGMINVVPDFLSFAETRWVIGLIERRPTPLCVMALLLLDLIFTAAIFIVSAVLLATLLLALGAAMPPEGQEISITTLMAWCLQIASDIFEHAHHFSPQDELGNALMWGLPIAYLTTFFTSIWLWCSLLSSLLWRIADRILTALGGGLRGLTAVERHPLLCLAVVLDLVIALIFALSAPFVVQWG